MNRTHDSEKRTTSPGLLTRWQITIYVCLGIVLPVLAINQLAIRSIFIFLYPVGARIFLLPRVTYLYILVGSGIVTLFLWIVFFRKRGKKCNGLIAGILLFNAFTHLFFFIIKVYFLLDVSQGMPDLLDVLLALLLILLPPFCVAIIYLKAGLRAIKIARTVMAKRYVALTAIAGVVVISSLLVVRQPWELIKHLPNARGAELSGLNLSHVCLTSTFGVTMQEANLSSVDFSHAILGGALNLSQANLQNVDLSHAMLSGVNLEGADLSGANLKGATIYEVNLTGANLQNADLSCRFIGRVSMSSANLGGADLSGLESTSYLSRYLEGAVYDSATLWPEGFDPNSLNKESDAE